MTATYVVKTDEGYVGKYTLTEPLRSTMPKSHAYCYATFQIAEQVASMFPGINATVEEVTL